MQQMAAQQYRVVFGGLVALYCLYGAVRGLVAGAGTWWLWLLAAAAQLAAAASWRVIAQRLGTSEESEPAAATRRRHRRAVWIAVPAALCMMRTLVLGDHADRDRVGLATVAAVALAAVALVGFVAAGWAVVWVTSERSPTAEPTQAP